MTKLSLSFSSVDYDRIRSLINGMTPIEGIDLNFLPLPVEETFLRQLKYQEFDVSEMSMSSYVLTLNEPDPPFVALPVFPSRYFRHQTMFVNRNSGIERPEDLVGKTVGVPEYQITAGVWQRGMLRDEYGVSPRDMKFFSGGVEQAGRVEKIQLDLPPDIDIHAIDPGETLSDMLCDGKLDALFTAHVPSCFYTDENVERLFPDYKAVEQRYFSKTGIFPIMHVIVIKRELYEKHPWIARSLTKGFEESLQHAREDLMYRSSLKVMLPWLSDHVEETQRALGEDFWTYGLERNRHVLETFLEYSWDQGLAKRQWRPEDIFVESASADVLI
ncbi:ABC transporter substrate-binding protein [Microbacterium sp. SYP-A9085]|uniref:PhnD/SsuA/transferrin family substrate-binding protein n=1 Tax=Microbacterium sp. SYP-A9085 TaxID=2664454 RepID=UPI00129AFF0F|nr:PhnD/SsuA/transferrin family substrate-binding protein [Microbacterium sp. SYP-A9085]MRH28011.1 ABC transporter substrate-binding protein [Microbacterium sp. SYP-A9085]